MNHLQLTQRIFADQLGLNEWEVTEDKDIHRDLGCDSLDDVELIMAFEEEFGIEIDDEEAERLKTVGDVVKALERKVPSLNATDHPPRQ